jgi:ATP-dependent RNA helicase DeaD
LSALRRVLDEQNPASAIVFVREPTSEAEVGSLLRALGYSGPAATVHAGRAASPDTSLVVLFDLPATQVELREAVGSATAIALVQPRQLESLRALAAGGALRAYSLPDAGRRARAREVALRDELQQVIAGRAIDREILALEPLLDDYDGVEIAAAAIKLLERERERAAAQAAAPAVTPSTSAGAEAPRKPRDSKTMARLFVTVGEKDNVRPADLLSAIANQPGMNSGAVGKIDIRQSHSTVEVAVESADSVIERLTGTTIRGRRVVARRDNETRRPPRTSDRPTGGGGRPRRDAGSGRGNRR